MTVRLTRGDTMPDRLFGPVDQSMVHDYARASGDTNPVHLDADIARSAGLDGTILHGMYLMGIMDRALRDWHQGIEILALSARFLTPVLCGATLVVSGKVVADSLDGRKDRAVMRLFVRTSTGEVALMGEAQIVNQEAPSA